MCTLCTIVSTILTIVHAYKLDKTIGKVLCILMSKTKPGKFSNLEKQNTICHFETHILAEVECRFFNNSIKHLQNSPDNEGAKGLAAVGATVGTLPLLDAIYALVEREQSRSSSLLLPFMV